MVTTRTALGVIGTTAVLAIGALIYTIVDVRTAKTTLAVSGARLESLRTKQQELQRQIGVQTERASAVEADNAELQKAVQGVQTAIATPEPGSAAHQELVESRIQRASGSWRDGYLDAALKECLWCYDEGTAGVPSLVSHRSFALRLMARIAEKYPPALVALRARRDRAEQEMLANPNDQTLANAVVCANKSLGEDSRNLALFDQLPPADLRRQAFLFDRRRPASLPFVVSPQEAASVAFPLFDQLVEARRYTDVVTSYPYEQMNAHFESGIRLRSVQPTLVEATARGIEALAGAGQLDQARALARKLLRNDGSAQTKALLQQHIERAGQPGLLATLPK